MIRFTALALAAVVASTIAFAQQPAATPKATPAKPAPATPARTATVPSNAAAVFEIARVNPGNGAKTRRMQVENLGKTSTVLVGDAVLTRAHLTEASTGSEKIKVTSGAKPETRDVAVIRFRFTKDGRKAFSDLTRQAKGQLLAVIIDGKIVAMPKVNEAITGNEFTVSGNFTPETAKALAAKVNAK